MQPQSPHVPSPRPSLPARAASVLLVLLAGTLALTAAAKAWSLFQGQPFLNRPDPVFGVTHRSLLIAATLAELLAAAIALRPSSPPLLRGTALTWIGCALAGYRTLLWAVDAPAACPCLGGVTAAWPWLAHHQDAVLLPLLALLLLGLPIAQLANTRNQSR